MRLDEYLRGKKLSHNKFARLSGVAQSTISRIVRIERGLDDGVGCSRAVAVKIMATTSGCVSINDLMGTPSVPLIVPREGKGESAESV